MRSKCIDSKYFIITSSSISETGYSTAWNITFRVIHLMYITFYVILIYIYIYTHTCVKLKDRKRSMSQKRKDHNALWHQRNSHNAKFRVVAVFKQPRRVLGQVRLRSLGQVRLGHLLAQSLQVTFNPKPSTVFNITCTTQNLALWLFL